MQPEQPNTPSQGTQVPDAAPQESASDEPREGSSPGWWQRLFNRRPAQETSDGSGEEGAEAGSASSRLTLTQEELNRRIQSEADRRDAARNLAAQQRERKRLRDEDPWAYAAQDREAEQSQEQTQGLQQFFANVGTNHDRVSIDPLMEMLPARERERIMAIQGAGLGLEGRKLVVTEALKALEKHWKTTGEQEAENRLRRNPAFRKQVLVEGRGFAQEPELLPATGASSTSRKVSDILRSHYGVGGGHNEAS